MSIDIYVTSKIQKQSLIHSWRTSIQDIIQGKEKRSALLTWPRIKLDNELRLIAASERNYIRSSLYQNVYGIWGFPFVHDKTLLTSEAAAGQKVLTVGETSYRHFYDGRGCILVDPSDWKSYEYGVIDTVDSATQITMAVNLTQTWPINTCVYPIYEYRISETQEVDARFRQLNFARMSATETFESSRSFSYSVPSSGAPTYNGLDLFLTKPLYPITEEYNQPFDLLTFLGLKYASSLYDKAKFAFKTDFTVVSRADIWAFLEFFDSKQGRYQTFYMPSWNDDIIPTAAIGAADTTLTVEQIYLTDAEITGRHLYIRLPDGSYVCREITDLLSPTSIQIDSSIGTAVSAANLSKMLLSFLYKVRFNVDEILFEYVSDEIANTKLHFKQVF